MAHYNPGELFSMRPPEPLLMEPGTRVSLDLTSGFCSQRYYGEVKAYRHGRSLVLFDGGWLKFYQPEYLRLATED